MFLQSSAGVPRHFRVAAVLGIGLTALGVLVPPGRAESLPFSVGIVVNNGTLMPGESVFFNAYNQPSINDAGLVVFRARGKGGGQGQPPTGIYSRLLPSLPFLPAVPSAVATRGSLVPQPNNQDATFVEFPSFPRLDASSDALAFRGQSSPVWRVSPDGELLGTSGVYSTLDGVLGTAVSQLGALPGFERYAVPGTNLRFDQFPGAPSPTGDRVVFKGNWTTASVGSATGVYFRDVRALGGDALLQRIADTQTLIPGDPLGRRFGSTAPPSAAGSRAVFLGVDVEEAPTVGGLYLSQLDGDPEALKPLVAIGGLADLLGPGGLRQIGEAVSFNGKALAFWGAWGEATVQQQLLCGTDGNQALLEYCREQSPAGDGVYIKEVPVNQGIFLTEVDSLVTRLVASTGAQFDTFLNWNFSGRPPGVGESEEPESELELARWRSSAFLALEDRWLAFKAEQLAPVDGSVVAQVQDGIYLADLLTRDNGVQSLLQTGQDGGMLDPQAKGMAITALGLERDGFRQGRLVFVASMANEEESWAGIYTAGAPVPGPLPLLGVALAFQRARLLRHRQALRRPVNHRG
jgi:hypothetical protein